MQHFAQVVAAVQIDSVKVLVQSSPLSVASHPMTPLIHQKPAPPAARDNDV